jgi:predicted glycosyltransferase
MSERLGGARVLIYSHDSFGLGHLRRCRAIAHSLVEAYKGVSVLILSGSPIIGSFDFRARVDFVRVPGVIKLHNGEYTSLALHIDLEQTLDMRASIIQHTARTFAPHLFLVDKEPLGLKGEARATLEMLKARGTVSILGLRDVMDEPLLLRREWERKHVLPALERLYDEIWVYGLPQIADPLAGLRLPPEVRRKMVYTGYLPRPLPGGQEPPLGVVPEEPFVLVTAGGGGDGGPMIDWVLRAYESDPGISLPALIVLGPFMPQVQKKEMLERVERLERVRAITFDAKIELLMERALGVVAMGGYNTFCEILSLDKPAILVPRARPRREQLIRARRAQDLGLVRMLDADWPRREAVMARALRELPEQAPPSAVSIPGLLDGLEVVNTLVGRHLGERGVTERHAAG